MKHSRPLTPPTYLDFIVTLVAVVAIPLTLIFLGCLTYYWLIK